MYPTIYNQKFNLNNKSNILKMEFQLLIEYLS